MEEIRVQKYLSDCGVMSRRMAEREMEAGRITVNGHPVLPGTKIVAGRDEVRWRGKKIFKSTNRDKHVYIMLNKPRGFVTTMSDELERKCVASLVQTVGMRVYPVGRLDKNSEGLLLLTNDGDFANFMMHPRHQIAKIYHVRVRGEVSPAQLERMRSLTVLPDGTQIQAVKCFVVLRDAQSTVLSLELHEGKNRQIRKMCEACDLEIQRLQRVAIGGVEMVDLRVGAWKHLTPQQLEMLGYPLPVTRGRGTRRR